MAVEHVYHYDIKYIAMLLPVVKQLVAGFVARTHHTDDHTCTVNIQLLSN